MRRKVHFITEHNQFTVNQLNPVSPLSPDLEHLGQIDPDEPAELQVTWAGESTFRVFHEHQLRLGNERTCEQKAHFLR